MTVTKERNGSSLNIVIKGELDTNSAPELEAELKSGILDGITDLSFDFSDVTYVSSFGLRVLLYAQTTMTSQHGQMVVKNVSPVVMDVFDMTGFAGFLTIE